MGKETSSETVTEPRVINVNRPIRNLESASKIEPKKNTSDKFNSFGKNAGPIPRYSDDYEEFDDLERNEDTFAPETD